MSNDNKGRKSNQRMKPFLVYQYLLKESDENNAVSATKIVEYLHDLGLEAERRSIYKDIEEINKILWLLENEADIFEVEELIENDDFEDEKIIQYDSHQKGFYIRYRNYDVSDIRLISECIYSSRYISQSEADRLVKIMKDFVSQKQAETIRTDALVTDRIRTLNKNSLNNVSVIYDAMSTMLDGLKHEPEKISFQYLKYDIEHLGELTERRRGEKYIVSPYKLIINDGNYYLLAFDDYSQDIRTYRIDRMKNIRRLNIPRDGIDTFKKLDLKTYTQRVFSMFSGEEVRIKLRFVNSLLDVAIERFGTKDAVYQKYDDKHFTVLTKVEISDQFFGWICGFRNKVKILDPEPVVINFKEYLAKITGLYTKTTE